MQTKLQHSFRALNALSIVRQINHYPNMNEDIPSLCRKKKYNDIWRLLIQESCFSILLDDYSFFIFRINNEGHTGPDILSMSYYGCPYEFITFDDYIVETYGEEFLVLRYDSEIRAEYEQALEDSRPIDSPVTFRYDYSPELYSPARHPASHFHVGLNNEIRIGCARILDPLSFTAFVLRQQYSEIWIKRALPDCKETFEPSIRDNLPLIPKHYFSELDELEMYLR